MRARILLPTLLVFSALGLIACGCGSSGTTPSTVTSSGATSGKAPEAAGGGADSKSGSPGAGRTAGRHPKAKEKAAQKAAFTPKPHHDSGGGSGQFRTKGGDNSIQEYGDEPSRAVFDEAAAVLHDFLDARAAGAWRSACQRLAGSVVTGLVQQLAGQANGGPGHCAEILAALSSGAPPAVLREAAQADVGALRVKGESGFLLFRGAHGESFLMPMRREGGHWKVAAVAASSLG